MLGDLESIRTAHPELESRILRLQSLRAQAQMVHGAIIRQHAAARALPSIQVQRAVQDVRRDISVLSRSMDARREALLAFRANVRSLTGSVADTAHSELDNAHRSTTAVSLSPIHSNAVRPNVWQAESALRSHIPISAVVPSTSADAAEREHQLLVAEERMMRRGILRPHLTSRGVPMRTTMFARLQLLREREHKAPPSPLTPQQLLGCDSMSQTLTIEHEEPCSICLEPMKSGHIVLRLGCSHIHHRSCIMPWLQRSACCPLCKGKVALEASR